MKTNLGNESDEPVAKRPKTVPRLLDGKYFEILTTNWSMAQPKITARCTTCGRTRNGTIKSTGNFMDHYISMHANMVPVVENYRKRGGQSGDDLKQPTITSAFSQLTNTVVCFKIYFFVV